MQLHGTLTASCSRPCPITHNPYADRADVQGQKGWWGRWDICRRRMQCHHITQPSKNVGSHQSGTYNLSCLLHPLIHLSDTKVTSSLCLFQVNVLWGWCPRARAYTVCTNSMGIDVCVSGSGTDTPKGAYLLSITRPCTDSHTGGNMLYTTHRW